MKRHTPTMRSVGRVARVGAAVGFLLFMGLPGIASAAVRAGSAQDPLDQQVQSLDGRIITEAVGGAASYDEVAGIVNISLTTNRPLEKGDSISITLSRRCNDTGSTPPRLSLTIRADQPERSSASLADFVGTAAVAIGRSADGNTITASTTNGNFAGRDYRCVTINGADDTVEFFFAGYAPLPDITASVATGALEEKLSATYGEWWEQGWARCPSVAVAKPDPDLETDGSAQCFYEVALGSQRYRGGFATVRPDDLRWDVKLLGSTYTKKMRRCQNPKRVRYANRRTITGRRVRVSGLVGCATLMMSDVNYDAERRFPRSLRDGYRTAFHGTNMAGFGKEASFECFIDSSLRGRARHYRMSCWNDLDWGFTYRFTVRAPAPKRAAPKRRSQPRSACSPYYQGVCLPVTGDIDCGDISARDFRVVGGDPYRLDGDNDGVACES